MIEAEAEPFFPAADTHVIAHRMDNPPLPDMEASLKL